MGIPVLVSDKTGYSEWVSNGKNGIVLQSPVTAESIGKAFFELRRLIENPAMTPDEIRNSVRELDNENVCKKLVSDFLML